MHRSKNLFMIGVTVLAAVSMVSANALADNESNYITNQIIHFENKEVHIYPIMTNLPTGITSGSKVNNIVPLAKDEDRISLSFSSVDNNEIYFVSIFDIETGYVTPASGVPATQDKFTVKGLTGGHNYHVRVSSLLGEHIVSGTIQTGFEE